MTTGPGKEDEAALIKGAVERRVTLILGSKGRESAAAIRQLQFMGGLTWTDSHTHRYLKHLYLFKYETFMQDQLLPHMLQDRKLKLAIWIGQQALNNFMDFRREAPLICIINWLMKSKNNEALPECQTFLSDVWNASVAGDISLPRPVLGLVLSKNPSLCENIVSSCLRDPQPSLGGKPQLLVLACSSSAPAFQLVSRIMLDNLISNHFGKTISHHIARFVQSTACQLTHTEFIFLYPPSCQYAAALLKMDHNSCGVDMIPELLSSLEEIKSEWHDILVIQYPATIRHMYTYVMKHSGQCKGRLASRIILKSYQLFGGPQLALEKVSK